MNKKYRLIICIAVIAATVCFIWSNSILSRETSSEVSSGFSEFIMKLFNPNGACPFFNFIEQHIRKIAHFSEFFLLGAELFVLIRLNFRISVQNIFNIYSCGLVVAVADESIQLVSGRGDMVQDILLDFSGAACAMTFLLLIYTAVHFAKSAKRKNRN